MEDEITSGSKFVGGARLSRHSKTSKKKKTIQTMLMKYFMEEEIPSGTK